MSNTVYLVCFKNSSKGNLLKVLGHTSLTLLLAFTKRNRPVGTYEDHRSSVNGAKCMIVTHAKKRVKT